MANNKELSNTLTINNNTYNINAVKSDEAKKVANYLMFHRKHYDGTDYLSSTTGYNGSVAGLSINYVDAKTGGEFEGPIKADDHDLENGAEISPKAVLNYTDLKYYLGTLTGIPWYFWRRKASSSEYELKGNQPDNTANHMAIILGAADDYLDSFVKYNYNNKKFPLFIYICNSGDARTVGEMYLGNDLITRVDQLTRLASSAFIIKSKTDTSIDAYYDYERLKEAFDEIDSRLDSHTADIDALEKAILDHDKRINTNYNSILRFKNGQEKVKYAERAQYDLDGNDIRRWYYRCASPYNSNNKAYSNTITINANIPTDNVGNDGDIWIKYEET